MTTTFDAIWQAQRRAGLEALRGTRLDATVPVRQRVVDRLLRGLLQRFPQAELGVRLRDGNRIAVDASVRVLGFPTSVRLLLQLDADVDLRRDPHLRLRLAEPSMMWNAVRAMGAALGLLPPGIVMAADGMRVDLPRLATHLGYADLLPHLQALAFDGRDGVLWVRARGEVVEVPAGDASATSPSRGSGSGGRSSAIAPGEVLSDLQGAEAAVRLRVHQSLVNAVLGAALEAAAAPSSAHPAVDPKRVLMWTRELQLSFEDGWGVVDTRLVLDEPTNEAAVRPEIQV